MRTAQRILQETWVPTEGGWQIYRKIKGSWVSSGAPMKREDAETRVLQMRSSLSCEQFAEEQPHCVPL